MGLPSSAAQPLKELLSHINLDLDLRHLRASGLSGQQIFQAYPSHVFFILSIRITLLSNQGPHYHKPFMFILFDMSVIYLWYISIEKRALKLSYHYKYCVCLSVLVCDLKYHAAFVKESGITNFVIHNFSLDPCFAVTFSIFAFLKSRTQNYSYLASLK